MISLNSDREREREGEGEREKERERKGSPFISFNHLILGSLSFVVISTTTANFESYDSL